MKNRIAKLSLITVAFIVVIVSCYGLYYLVDHIWNGSFVDWFEGRYMVTDYRYLPGVREEIHSLDWGLVKPLLLNVLIVSAVFLVVVVLIASYFSSRHGQKQAITEASRLLRVYMNGSADAADVFPKKYAEMSAQLSSVKSTLLQNEQVLKEEAARRNDLVAYLAHDLKTPLTSVIGYLSLIEEASDMPAEQRAKYVNITLDKAYRLEKMINEFFEITRYNLQQISITKETIDLYYMLVQLTDELSPLLSANGNTIILNADENVSVPGDPDKLARVFNNVLRNAAAYSFPNTEIVISAEENDNSVTISFTNKGKTVPKEKLAVIFEKFYRMDEARTSNTGGAGLGLAIAKEIVTLHGGTITAESDNNKVTFTITLPKAN